jgi:uncharacterized protein YndB with AHSA1/START domain
VRVEAQITIGRPVQEVFDYIAHAEHLPEYVADFASVRQLDAGEVGVGTRYSYRMRRGEADGTFAWTRFEPHRRLAWQGPRVKVGPGSMEPAGWWELEPAEGGTHVKLVMAPTPGGLFKLLAPFLAAGMRTGNAQALERLKQRLERGPRPRAGGEGG